MLGFRFGSWTLPSPLFAPEGEAGGGATAGAAGTTGATGDAATGQTTGGQTGSQASGATFTQADLDRVITDRLAREKAKWDADAKSAAQKAAEKAANDKLPEIERLTKERDQHAKDLDEIKTAMRERDAKDAVLDAAKKAGAPDPSPIWKLVKSDLTYDDGGKITNLDEALKDAKLLAPQLFKAAATKVDAGAGNHGNSKQGANAWIREQLATR